MEKIDIKRYGVDIVILLTTVNRELTAERGTVKGKLEGRLQRTNNRRISRTCTYILTLSSFVCKNQSTGKHENTLSGLPDGTCPQSVGFILQIHLVRAHRKPLESEGPFKTPTWKVIGQTPCLSQSLKTDQSDFYCQVILVITAPGFLLMQGWIFGYFIALHLPVKQGKAKQCSAPEKPFVPSFVLLLI